MEQPAGSPAPPRQRMGPTRRGRMVFLLAAVVLVVAVWWIQRRRPTLAGWGTDLASALHQARAERRGVLVLFQASPPSQVARDLARTTLAKKANRRAAEAFVRAVIAVDVGLTCPIATTYRLRRLPTLMILDADGREKNRREGPVAEVDFREGFLNCRAVRRPG